MKQLFPEETPEKYLIQSGYMPTNGSHSIFFEQYGIASGTPALFLHGGPGGGCQELHRRFFNPERYCTTLFDQRGCGRSLPHALLEENDTSGLIDDIEQLREHLGVEKWLVFGGSWGSTLALAYAEQYPDRVSALVLRGIFLCRPQDIHWFYQYGASQIFPDYWQDYIAAIPEAEHDNLLEAYYKRLTSNDPATQLCAAKAWSVWEGRCSSLQPSAASLAATEAHFGDPQVALAMARIECHYFMNQAFLEPNQIISNAAVLRSIPGIIVHGRYDCVCPIDQAFALHQAWPEAELKIIADAGHAATEAGIVDALVNATEHFADVLTAQSTESPANTLNGNNL